MGAVNADQHQSLGQKYEIRGFPTIKIFGSNKNKPKDFSGPRTAQGFVDELFKELKNQVQDRLGGKKSGGSSGGGGSKSRKEVNLRFYLCSLTALLYVNTYYTIQYSTSVTVSKRLLENFLECSTSII